MTILSSPVCEISFLNSSFFVKRDDLLDRDFSGNKARKFYYFLKNDFPRIKRVVSYGSSQSNAMYSLSVLAKLKGWEFYYFTNHISSYLKKNPHGNYKAALENGMKIFENRKDFMKEIGEKEDSLFIREGGAVKESEYGIKILAKEIEEFIKERGLKDPKVFLPSGTGTTALYLQKHLPFSVYTCACVGDEDYLKKQFFQLERDENIHPKILKLDKKYHFGKLYGEFYAIWLRLLKETGIEFDLLYDPKGWLVIEKYLDIFKKDTVYVHQGGILGNESMKKRYERKFSIDKNSDCGKLSESYQLG